MEDLRGNIVSTAADLFLQYGIRSVSIDNVCSELHISKKTFYSYFSQKEELVDAVLTYQENMIFDRLKKLLFVNNAIESLILIIKEMKKAIESKSPAFYFDLQKYYRGLSEKHDNIKCEEMRQWFTSNIEQGIKEGYYRDDMDIELMSLFHTIGINGSLREIQEKTQKYTKKRMIEFYIDMVMHLIANEKGLQYFHEHYNKNE